MKIPCLAALLAAGCGDVHRQPVAAAAPDAGAPPPAADDAAVATGTDAAGTGETGPDAAPTGAGPDATPPSPDGPAALSGAWRACGQLGQGGPKAVALSEDGRLAFVVAAVPGDIEVYDMATGQRRAQLPVPARVQRLYPSHDGQLVAAAMDIGGGPGGLTQLRVVRASDGSLVLASPFSLAGAPSFSADDEQILVVPGPTDERGDAQLHRLVNPMLLRDYGPATAATFGPGGDVLVYDGKTPGGGTLSTFHQGNPPVVRPFPYGPDAFFSPRGTYLASPTPDPATGQSQWAIHRVSDGKALATLFGAGLRFSPDEQAVVTYGSTSGGMFDPVTSQGLTLPIGLGVIQPLEDLALGPGGKTALAASSSGLLEAGVAGVPEGVLWDIGFGTGSPIVSIAASANGRWLATGSGLGARAVVLWDLAHERRQLSLDASGPVTSVTFAGDSARFAHTNGSGATEWALELDAPVWTAERASGTFGAEAWMAAYARDWSRTAVAAFSAPVALLERGGTVPALELKTGERQIGVAFTPDGQHLATSEPALYRTADGAPVWSHAQPFPTLKDVNYSENWVDVSPDGALMVVSRFRMWQSVPWFPPSDDSDSYLTDTRIYRVADGTLVKDLGHLPRRPVFSPDGAWLAAGATALEWASGRVVALTAGPGLLEPHLGRGAVSTFLPDGSVAVGDGYGIVNLFCP